jgi:hypothetical protein
MTDIDGLIAEAKRIIENPKPWDQSHFELIAKLINALEAKDQEIGRLRSQVASLEVTGFILR